MSDYLDVPRFEPAEWIEVSASNRPGYVTLDLVDDEGISVECTLTQEQSLRLILGVAGCLARLRGWSE